jgi:hypothetical protein
MFCPQCRAEYRPGFIRCSDCDIELVDRLPDEANEPTELDELGPGDWEVIATVQSPVERGQICSFLEANGIPAQSIGESLQRSYGGVGAIQVRVPRNFAYAARELLKEADEGEFNIDASDT